MRASVHVPMCWPMLCHILSVPVYVVCCSIMPGLKRKLPDCGAGSDDVAALIGSPPTQARLEDVRVASTDSLLLSPAQQFQKRSQSPSVNLNLAVVPRNMMSMKYVVAGIVVAVHGVIHSGTTVRRQVVLCDRHGCASLTLWSKQTEIICEEHIGKAVFVTSVTVHEYKNVRSLNCGKDALIAISTHPELTDVLAWWRGAAVCSMISIPDILSTVNVLVSFCGMLAAYTFSEVQMQHGPARYVHSFTFVDGPSSQNVIVLKQWTSTASTLPVAEGECFAVRRARVLPASDKYPLSLEFVDNGTTVISHTNAELQGWWQTPTTIGLFQAD